MIALNPEQRSALRTAAHGLKPVVSIADQGLSPAVLKEIDSSLKAHALIKIRVYSDDRAARDAYLQKICEDLGAAPVQHIGKLLVVWRPPEDATPAKRKARASDSGHCTKRSQQGSRRK